MPEGLAAALATPGFGAVVAAILVAGLIYGFAGFGSALVFVPVATLFLAPPVAVAAFSLASMGSVATVLPGAWARADRRAAVIMIAAAALAMPLGVWLLRTLDPLAIRWTVCAVVGATLLAAALGARLRVGAGTGPCAAVGGVAGLVGGATGLLGPVMILVGLGAGKDAATTRADIATFLTVINVVLLPQLAVQGALGAPALWLGALLLPVYTLGTRAGRALFRPGAERIYKGLAYATVGGSVLVGLPLFD